MIEELLEFLSEIESPPWNPKPSTQTGNFCYLIAGLECLLASTLFRKFVLAYSRLPQKFLLRDENIEPLCVLITEYSASKDPGLLPPIADFIFRSIDEKSRGHQEDINVLFLVLEKSFAYSLLFSKFQYIEGPNAEIPLKGPESIYIFLHGTSLVADALHLLNDPQIFAVSVLCGAHYEVFVRREKKMVPMNTNYTSACRWSMLIVFCSNISKYAELIYA